MTKPNFFGIPETVERRLAILARYDQRCLYILLVSSAATVVVAFAAIFALVPTGFVRDGEGRIGLPTPLKKFAPDRKLVGGYSEGGSATKGRGGDDCESYGCPIRSPEADEISLGAKNYRDGAGIGYCSLTRQGNQKVENQDRGFIIRPFLYRGLGYPPNLSFQEEDFLIGIFDGHGDEGQYVSEYALRDLPERLAEKLSKLRDLDEADVRRALFESFVECDSAAPPIKS